MKIQTEITIEDMIAFGIYHFERSPSAMKIERFAKYFFLGLIFFLVVISLLYLFSGQIRLAIGNLIWGITLLAYLVFQTKIRRYLLTLQLRGMYSEGRNQGTLGSHEITLRDDGILEVTDFGEQLTKWHAVDKAIKTEDYIFVYISSVSAHLIPRRGFNDESAYGEFYNLILEKKGKLG